jgi:hypothetical protein
MVEQALETKAGADGKKDRNRSFSYPAFSLPEAIEKARILWQNDQGNWIPVRVASEHWKLSPKSSSAARGVAALAHYGLIEEHGSKENRRIRLNQRAKTILLAPPERSTERHQAIQAAALTPKAYHDLWTRHDRNLPSDSILRFYLQSDRGMNEQVINEFIKDFKATVQFAKLDHTSTLSGQEGEEPVGSSGENEPRSAERLSDKQSRKTGEMPDIQRDNASAFDLPIPLAGGLQATLRVPASLSEENYKRLTENLTTILGLWKPTIVSEPHAEGA